MSVHEILRSATQQGVHFYLKNGKLAYKVKKGALSDTLKAQILAQRDAIITFLEQQQATSGALDLPPITPVPRSHSSGAGSLQESTAEAMPLSYAQQRLWFITQLGDSNAQYNLTGNFLIAGQFNRNAFEQAVQALLDRHEVLRTCIIDVNGEPQQRILSTYDLPLQYCDLSQAPNAQTQLQQIIEQHTQAAFNFASELMVRIVLVKLPDDPSSQKSLSQESHSQKSSQPQHMIFYCMHHIASDGWSRSIFKQELGQLYQAFAQGQPNPLAPLAVQYADYAQWQRQWLSGDLLNNATAYWQKQLANLPVLHNLPLDKPRPARQRLKGRSFTVQLSQPLSASIKQFNQQHTCTVFMLMQTAMAVLISRYSGNNDVVVGTAMTGRNHADLEGLIGFFINDLVIRTQCDGKQSFGALLAENKKTILDAYAHQHMPFEMLVETLNPQRSMSHSPLYQIKLDVQNNATASLDMGDLDTIDIRDTLRANQGSGFDTENENESDEHENQPEHTVKHDLYLSVTETEQHFSLSFRYNTDLFFANTIRRMLQHFVTLLEQVVANPDQTIASINWLSDAEQQQLDRFGNLHQSNVNQGNLNQGNENQSSADQNKQTDALNCLHHRFEAQAAKTPNAIAVQSVLPNVANAAHSPNSPNSGLSFGPDTLTYEQLNAEANQLAYYLIKQGIGPDMPVGLCVERSNDMLVAILGVLKAGAAYIPLDPQLPQVRLDTILTECGCKWMLTQSDLMGELSFGSCRVLPVDEQFRESMFSGFSTANPEAKSNSQSNKQANNLAYVIYTSGSTGQPKGVMVEHQAISRYCNHALNSYYTQEQSLSGAILATSYGFDLTAPCIYLPLFTGGTVTLLQEGQELHHLVDVLFKSNERYLLRLTPSHINGILALKPDDTTNTEKSSTEHVFVIGGEPLTVSTASALQHRTFTTITAHLKR